MSNNGNSGEVGFVLQHLSESGEWNLAAEGNTTIKSGDSAKVSLDVLANGEPGDYLQYRLLLIESGVEKEALGVPRPQLHQWQAVIPHWRRAIHLRSTNLVEGYSVSLHF